MKNTKYSKNVELDFLSDVKNEDITLHTLGLLSNVWVIVKI